MTLVALARNPAPSGSVVGMFKGYDGAMLRYAIWQPTRRPARGTVCLFNGRGEYIEKYFETIADLRRRGFWVATMDWRGQGGSYRPLRDPRKGYIRSFSEYDGDLLRFMKDVVLPDCRPPFIALAHSMGGNILLRNARQRGSWFQRMVLSAPMLELSSTLSPVPHSIARMSAEVACLFGLGNMYVRGGSSEPWERMPFDNNPLTSDRERFMRNKAIVETAPELALGSPTLAWLRAAYRSMAELSRSTAPRSIAVPLLVVSAGEDRVVSTHATSDFAEQLKIGAHVVIPDSKHEILQERDEVRQQFWAAFDAYLATETAI